MGNSPIPNALHYHADAIVDTVRQRYGPANAKAYKTASRAVRYGRMPLPSVKRLKSLASGIQDESTQAIILAHLDAMDHIVRDHVQILAAEMIPLTMQTAPAGKPDAVLAAIRKTMQMARSDDYTPEEMLETVRLLLNEACKARSQRFSQLDSLAWSCYDRTASMEMALSILLLDEHG